MKLKTRAIALLAGSALALSLATGAIAQTEKTATVTLAEKQDAQGCMLTSIYFPNLVATWDGTTYALPPGLRQVVLELGFEAAAPGDPGTCNVSVWGSDFEGQNHGQTFGIGRLELHSLPVSGDPTVPTQIMKNVDANANGVRLDLDLSDLTLEPDEYVSTLTFTVTNGT